MKYEFDDEVIMKKIGYIFSQYCSLLETVYVTVNTTKMRVIFLSNVDRYILEDAIYHLRLSNGTYEEVLMGISEKF